MSFGTFKTVLEMFRGCSGGVLGVFWGCSGDVLGMFWGCSRGVLGVLRGLCGVGGLGCFGVVLGLLGWLVDWLMG